MAEPEKPQETGSDKEADMLLVAVSHSIALIRVRGRGSFKVGPSLKQFVQSAIGSGCRQFILDMDECIGMDSTFMGVLAGLALRLKNEAGGGVMMMNLTSKTMALLETLGLDHLIKTFMEGSPSEDLKQKLSEVAGLSKLPASIQDKKLTLETMLSAHEDLVKADPENLPKFKNVMSYLSADLKQIEGA